MAEPTDPVKKALYLEPKLDGERFEEHSIPLEVLGDLVAVQKLLTDLANETYKNKQGAARGPRNLRRGVSLQLKTIRDGSAFAGFQLRVGEEVGHREQVRAAFEAAKRRFLNGLNAALSGDATAAIEAFGLERLELFDKIGSSLKHGEYVEFAPDAQTPERRARLDTSTRAFLAGIVRSNASVEQEVEVRGTVVRLDRRKPNFEILQYDGTVIACSLADNPDQAEFFEIAADANKLAAVPGRVVISGTGRVSRDGVLLSVEDVETLERVPPFDVLNRLEELKSQSPDSFASEGGSLGGMRQTWLSKNVRHVFDGDNSLPAIFLSSDDEVFLEWHESEKTLSLEIDTFEKTGSLQVFDRKVGCSNFSDFELDSEEGWRKFADFVGQHRKA